MLSRYFLILILGCGLSASVSLSANAQVIINEIMQSNVDCIMDDLNEFPDSWVEVYNNSNDDVVLSEYSIGLSNIYSESYTLPEIQLGANQYALIYCDKESVGIHTDFTLDTGKGAVYLFYKGDVIDNITHKKQPAPNISYGRLSTNSDEWGYQLSPTPGYKNCGEVSSVILGDPVFSQKGGVWQDNMELSISLLLPDDAPDGTQIRYTTNGSEPVIESMLYESPIAIDTTTIIRAKLFKEGCLSPQSVAQSYIKLEREITLPVISLITDERYLTDPQIGIYVKGEYSKDTPNYMFDWRRPFNIEYFDADMNNASINQLCEGRIQGGVMRKHPLKSMALYAKKRFGVKRFEHQMFPDSKPELCEFKSILLRNSGNDFTRLYMRDAVVQTLTAANTDVDWQAYQPAILYVNGSYKGIINIRERSNEDNIYSNYEGLEDIDMIENWKELKEGDMQNYDSFTSFYSSEGHTIEEYNEWMDVDEFMNLMISNIFFNNQDFPGNNIIMWRPRTDNGKWRWIMKDTDYALGNAEAPYPSYNTFEWLYTGPSYDGISPWANTESATRLFRNLMEVPEFRTSFIDRFSIYMGDFLNGKSVKQQMDSFFNKISYEYPFFRALYDDGWEDYAVQFERAQKWANDRPAELYRIIGDFYNVGSSVPLSIKSDTDQPVHFTLNGIDLSNCSFDGQYFEGKTISLQGTNSEGDAITNWTIRKYSDNAEQMDINISSDVLQYTIPLCSKLEIIANPTNTDIVEMQNAINCDFYRTKNGLIINNKNKRLIHISVYDLNGRLFFSDIADKSKTVITLPYRECYILKVEDKIYKIK